MFKVAIVDDDEIYLRTIQGVFHFMPDYLCVLCANSMEAFWDEIPPKVKLDIILIDIELPGQSGIEALPALAKRFPKAELIMCTRHEDSSLLIKAISLGASGYLTKDFPIVKLQEHLASITKGGAAISPQMAKYLITYINPPKTSAHGTTLSGKEEQILHLFSLGNSYEETAEILGLTLNGIRFHVKQIYKKLQVDNKTDAIRAATRLSKFPSTGE